MFKFVNKLKSVYHFFLAWFGNILYGFPSRKIFVLGVTGTKGKSTTLELINAILEAAGKKTALISSIRFKIGDKTEKNMTGTTMPGRFFLQRFLRKAVSRGCKYALIEVTSQGILQHRHKFIHWDAALYTNLRPEHIEAHGSFGDYRQAKIGFFDYAARWSGKPRKLFFLNEMDSSHQYFTGAVNGCGEIIYFSRESFVEKELNRGKESIGEWLLSNFNLENAAAASAFAQSQGIDWPLIRKTLRAFKGVPGRLEYLQRKPFAAVIDYAHTPDSLEEVYQTLGARDVRNVRVDRFEQAKRSITNRRTSNLICVLGAAGGGRDKWKRPEMGRIAADYCREIILTNEDPYDEDPARIIGDIKAGISNARFPTSKIKEIVDRREAIRIALALARKGDTVIVTGKGSENYIHVAGGKKVPWGEREIVEQLLNDLQ